MFCFQSLWMGVRENEILLQSIFALSASHRWGCRAAARYKLSAFRLLSSSIRHDGTSTISQFATCMILCICDVRSCISEADRCWRACKVFDSADGSWSVHLKAANSMITYLCTCTGLDTSMLFLESWFGYHNVLAVFSTLNFHVDQSKSYIPSLITSEASSQVYTWELSWGSTDIDR